MTSIEFELLCNIEMFLAKMTKLLESMDARLQNLESSIK